MPSVKWPLGFAKYRTRGAPSPFPRPPKNAQNSNRKTYLVPPKGHISVKNMWSDSQLMQRYRTGRPPPPYTRPQECPKIGPKERTWYQARRHVCAKASLRNPDKSRNALTTAGNSMTSSERPLQNHFWKKRRDPSRIEGERILEMLWRPQVPWITGLGASQLYHPFQNHYTHKIIIFKWFRALQLQFSGPTGINFRYSYSFVGLTGICLYSYSSVQLHKKWSSENKNYFPKITVTVT